MPVSGCKKRLEAAPTSAGNRPSATCVGHPLLRSEAARPRKKSPKRFGFFLTRLIRDPTSPLLWRFDAEVGVTNVASLRNATTRVGAAWACITSCCRLAEGSTLKLVTFVGVTAAG